MKSKRLRRGLLCLGIVFGSLLLYNIVATESVIKVRTNGRKATILFKLSGAFSSFCDSTYHIFYLPDNGPKGAVDIRASFDAQPIIVLCPTNDDALYCLYGDDMGFRLIKIHTKVGFQPFLPQSPLNWIVSSSSYMAEQANKGDWNVTLDYLRQMDGQEFKKQSAPVVNAGLVRMHTSKQRLLDRLQNQVDAIYGSSRFIVGRDRAFRRRTGCESGSSGSCESPGRRI